MTDTQVPPPPSPDEPVETAGEPWWKRKKAKLPLWGWITIGVVILFGAAAAGSDEGDDESVATTEATSVAVATDAPVDSASPDTEAPVETASAETEAPVETEPTTTTITAPAITTTTTSTTTTTEPVVPVEFRNALRKAESYLEFTAFSQPGLVEQLEFEQFSTEASEWAVQNISVDWNAQAAAKAESYLEFSTFSEGGLRDQLDFEGFTAEQVDFAIAEMVTLGLI